MNQLRDTSEQLPNLNVETSCGPVGGMVD
jgi:hypothetical protein